MSGRLAKCCGLQIIGRGLKLRDRVQRLDDFTKGGLLRIDAAKRGAAEQLDGQFVVHSNDDSLTPA